MLMKLTLVANVIKLFCHNLSFKSLGNMPNSCVNDAGKRFITLTLMVNFIKMLMVIAK
jgi:hypothetical protein